jgi:hypothetical protein
VRLALLLSPSLLYLVAQAATVQPSLKDPPFGDQYRYLRCTPTEAGIGGGYSDFQFWKSSDGASFYPISKNGRAAFYGGSSRTCFAPSCFYWHGFWWTSFDSHGLDSANKVFSFTKSPDLINWATVQDVTLSGIVGHASDTVFAGRWFVEGDQPYWSFSLTGTGGFLTWPLDATMTTWAPVVNIINTNSQDATITKRGDVYWCFVTIGGRSLCSYTNNGGFGALTNPALWFAYATNILNTPGATTNFEAQNIIQTSNSLWRMYFNADQNGVIKTYYSDSTDLTTWTQYLPVREPGMGGGPMSIWEVPTGVKYQLANLEGMNEENRITTYVFTTNTTAAVPVVMTPPIHFGFGNVYNVNVQATATSDFYQGAEFGLSSFWMSDFGTLGQVGVTRTNTIHRPFRSNWAVNLESVVGGNNGVGLGARLTGTSSNAISWKVRFYIEQADGPVFTGAVADLRTVTSVESRSIIRTNFISGFWYTNYTDYPFTVSANAVLTEAAVAGRSELNLWIPGMVTNYSSDLTTAGTVARSMTNIIDGFIPAGAGYTFTNQSTGAGNSATPFNGQILVH